MLNSDKELELSTSFMDSKVVMELSKLISRDLSF